MDVKSAAGGSSKVRSTAKNTYIREYLYHHKQAVDRNMKVKGTNGEGLEVNYEFNNGNYRKGVSCYIVTEILAEL